MKTIYETTLCTIQINEDERIMTFYEVETDITTVAYMADPTSGGGPSTSVLMI